MSDYVGLISALINLAIECGIKEERINNLLGQSKRISGLFYQPKKLRGAIEGRFELDEVIRIEGRNDPHTISDKYLISQWERFRFCVKMDSDAKIDLRNRLGRAKLEKIR